jgi:hypothetical protein
MFPAQIVEQRLNKLSKDVQFLKEKRTGQKARLSL